MWVGVALCTSRVNFMLSINQRAVFTSAAWAPFVCVINRLAFLPGQDYRDFVICLVCRLNPDKMSGKLSGF